MDLKEKVEKALRQYIRADYVDLDDHDGISGFVVSNAFRGLTALDRQMLIHDALRDFSIKFTKPELRRILAIAALTPVEFEVRGPGRDQSRQ